jgi:hypothetical protein
MDLNHKNRWILSPIVNGKPLASDYALQWNYPLGPVDGKALVHCTMNAHQLSAARKDTRLVILGSLYSSESVPDEVADHHKPQGAKRGMHLHDLLATLAKFHHYFEPES